MRHEQPSEGALAALFCLRCHARNAARLAYRCPDCGGILRVERPLPAGRRWRTSDFVSERVTLGEGGTLMRKVRPDLLHERFHGQLYVKDETRNPSGSFKDRLVAAAVSRALALGAPGIVCASSGNAGAAAACYAANAGVPAIIVCPESTPEGKVAQIAAYGATFHRVPGDYSRSFQVGIELAAESGFANVTTTYQNAYGVDALRLVGQEILDDLSGNVPDWVAVPTSSGPLVHGVWQGFSDWSVQVPRLVAAQSEGCAPIATAFREGLQDVSPWPAPHTLASGISDPLASYPDEGSLTLSLVHATGGQGVAVPDAMILSAMHDLARRAGLFSEPTGATSLAAMRQLFDDGLIGEDDTIVCLVTGNGAKDYAAWRTADGQV
ncbi:pyridoxal-phosphate dependent enzyme [Aureimonas frigidaquae]|uniref:Threonine synthase n=1 Tax=Aureimonas frigidaquae TaxID=424757 RepID=A0A0P0Z432_9HYPH|nr:pyridoxal-phosphate dependent enzyme [Aureimonas frigidaquae]BAT28807.1 threonine synthase [Aureimonas frigidaquae]